MKNTFTMKVSRLLLVLLIFVLNFNPVSFGQVPNIVWDKTLGGNYDDILSSIIATSDGGLVVGGGSYSGVSGDKTESSRGGLDYWIVKLNANRQKVWDKTIGGNSDDNLQSILATIDGGFLLAGYSTSSNTGDKTEPSKGFSDYWIVKLNSNGQKIWDKTIGGDKDDIFRSIVATSDGGFLLVGSSNSGISGDKTEPSKGFSDYWIVKLNSDGQKIWDKTFGGELFELFPKIISLSDGGFAVGGISLSGISGDKTEPSKGGYDFWIVKINENGIKIWDKSIGGSGDEYLNSIAVTSDGGFVVAGDSDSQISGDRTESSKGLSDYWVVKVNSNGQKIWDKTIGGNNNDLNSSIMATFDGGVIVGGQSASDDSGDKTDPSKGGFDYWIVKLDINGLKIWDKTIGHNNNNYSPRIVGNLDGSFLVGGYSESGVSGDKTEPSNGVYDYWIVKLGYQDAKPLVISLEPQHSVYKGTQLKVNFKATSN
ncbi:MAG: T9SS C-terminal target domain-containing protein [Cytophagaceae bacterium]|nr:T9SS C-terminal target domain-containing protein [Cytophagaceae bacterium]